MPFTKSRPLLLSLALAAALSAALVEASPAVRAAPAPAAGSVPVAELTHGGSALPAPERRATEQAIVAAADAAGVVVCRDGTSLTQPVSPALDQICSTPGLPRLWWDAEIGTEKSGDVEVLDVLLKVAIGGPPAESPQAIVPPHVLLPTLRTEAQSEERETALLDGIHRSLLAADELHAWLAGLKKRPELLRVRPASAMSASAGTVGAAGDATAQGRRKTHSAGRLRAWDKELREIADLLIDGHYLEGRDRATHLLKEDPPPEIAGRARELLAKADTKLTDRKSSPAGESNPIVIRPSQGAATLSGAPARRRWERSFDVRVARDDRGFEGGLDGQLLVSEDGVVFTRKRESRPDWAIVWTDLAAAHRAEGLWDVPYPLALAEKSGRVHHLVVVDTAGKPRPGGAVLSALAEGRLASRKGYK